MNRYFAAVTLALLPLIVRAADVESPPPPPADVSPWGIIIFGVLFFGMIVGFGVYMWYRERNGKQDS
jgi:hypothetical protein